MCLWNKTKTACSHQNKENVSQLWKQLIMIHMDISEVATCSGCSINTALKEEVRWSGIKSDKVCREEVGCEQLAWTSTTFIQETTAHVQCVTKSQPWVTLTC